MFEKKFNNRTSSRYHACILIYVLVTVILQTQLQAQEITTEFKQGFINPPFSAKPRTWWHWTRSNITKEGITKDLEWMKRIGIAGFQLSDVNAGGGQTVTNQILFGSPEWLDIQFSRLESCRRPMGKARRSDEEISME
jgi:hypothetical protein